MKRLLLNVENKENPYYYCGPFERIKDIIKFKENDNIYIFDFTVERLIKENKKQNIVIDFKKDEIIIEENKKIIVIPIVIIDKNISNEEILVTYKVDKNVIKLTIKEV